MYLYSTRFGLQRLRSSLLKASQMPCISYPSITDTCKCQLIDRGTGNALAASANRVFGIMSPIIALYADLSTPVPIYVSGALFISAGLLAVLLPYEPKGKASM